MQLVVLLEKKVSTLEEAIAAVEWLKQQLLPYPDIKIIANTSTAIEPPPAG
jgi:hypothetical protein